MTQAQFLSIDDLINELDIGKATVKFILNRFSHRFIVERINGEPLYSPSAIPVLIRIRDLLDSGLLPSQVEELIKNDSGLPETDTIKTELPEEDIRMSKDAIGFIQNLVQDIQGHQNRIARAHEKRAAAEERKAVAIEKRARAEEKKAMAMNNIAMALQEMNQQRVIDTQTMEVAGQAAQALTMTDVDTGEKEVEVSDFQDLDALLDHPHPKDSPIESGDLDEMITHPPEETSLDLDDLSVLTEEPAISSKDLDDLSALIDTVSTVDVDNGDLDNLLEETRPLPEPDDLTQLIDQAEDEGEAESGLDDLHSLIDQEPAQEKLADKDNIDDLSLLLDGESTGDAEVADPETLDNLSALIDDPPDDMSENLDSLDDLSLLVDSDSKPGEKIPVDDLWALVEGQSDQESMDDLSALIDTPESSPTETADEAPAPPSLKPDITPDQDLGKYKAAVMKIIIDLKNQGLGVEETTDRLNRDEVPTLSGKPEWGEKAIAKIYGFIESAK